MAHQVSVITGSMIHSITLQEEKKIIEVFSSQGPGLAHRVSLLRQGIFSSQRNS